MGKPTHQFPVEAVKFPPDHQIFDSVIPLEGMYLSRQEMNPCTKMLIPAHFGIMKTQKEKCDVL